MATVRLTCENPAHGAGGQPHNLHCLAHVLYRTDPAPQPVSFLSPPDRRGAIAEY